MPGAFKKKNMRWISNCIVVIDNIQLNFRIYLYIYLGFFVLLPHT